MLKIVSYAGTWWDSFSLRHCSEYSPKLSQIRDFITWEDQTQLFQIEPEDPLRSLTTILLSPLSSPLCLQASRTMVWSVSFLDKFISAVQPRGDTRAHKCFLEMEMASRSSSKDIQAKQLGLLSDCNCTEDIKHQSCKFSEEIFLTLTSILLQSNFGKERKEVSWLRQLSLTCWIKLNKTGHRESWARRWPHHKGLLSHVSVIPDRLQLAKLLR